MTWLITGGAGYIGSHVVQRLLDANLEVCVVDSLANGFQARVPANVEFQNLDIRYSEKLEKYIASKKFEGVVHMAGLKSVAESILQPSLYGEVNSRATKKLIEIAISQGIEKFIFSSSAAVYGNSQLGVVNEESPLVPISPYGISKKSAEDFLSQQIEVGTIKGTALRFFNVVGTKNRVLTDTAKDNLVPRVMEAIRNNKQPEIYGSNYPTPDGTCIRDFVDVRDVADAHYLATVTKNVLPSAINIGTGNGHSVLDVITTTNRLMDCSLLPIFAPPREGDVAKLVANVNLAHQVLNFKAKFDLKSSIESLLS